MVTLPSSVLPPRWLFLSEMIAPGFTVVGAAAGGWLADHAGESSVFMFGAALSVLWLIGSATMAAPPTRFGNNYSMGET